MKPKVLLVAAGLLGVVAAKANNGNEPGDGKGRKDELNGIVLQSESKKPIKDVTVTAYMDSKKSKTVTTEDDGTYSFDELKPGIYKFIFEKAGFRRVTKEKVVVKTDEVFQLNIEMIEASSLDLMPSPFHFSEF